MGTGAQQEPGEDQHGDWTISPQGRFDQEPRPQKPGDLKRGIRTRCGVCGLPTVLDVSALRAFPQTCKCRNAGTGIADHVNNALLARGRSRSLSRARAVPGRGAGASSLRARSAAGVSAPKGSAPLSAAAASRPDTGTQGPARQRRRPSRSSSPVRRKKLKAGPIARARPPSVSRPSMYPKGPAHRRKRSSASTTPKGQGKGDGPKARSLRPVCPAPQPEESQQAHPRVNHAARVEPQADSTPRAVLSPRHPLQEVGGGGRAEASGGRDTVTPRVICAEPADAAAGVAISANPEPQAGSAEYCARIYRMRQQINRGAEAQVAAGPGLTRPLRGAAKTAARRRYAQTGDTHRVVRPHVRCAVRTESQADSDRRRTRARHGPSPTRGPGAGEALEHLAEGLRDTHRVIRAVSLRRSPRLQPPSHSEEEAAPGPPDEHRSQTGTGAQAGPAAGGTP